MNKNIFPKWTNKLPLIVLITLKVKIAVIIFIFVYWFTPKHLEVGYQPEQPIPFSHKLHNAELGIDCRYCHNNVDKAAHSNIPATETCMNCHNQIKKDSPHIAKIKKSYLENEPIKWVKVHMLPDYVAFNHSRHVNSGISCVSCHGRVDQMEKVYQAKRLSMGWCLECHRAPEKHLRPKDKVYQLDWVAKENQIEMGLRLKEEYKINPKEHCSVCHK